jgi:hypothetical protein
VKLIIDQWELILVQAAHLSSDVTTLSGSDETISRKEILDVYALPMQDIVHL